MYDLPNSSGTDTESGTLVDLLDDEDLDNMWEEMEAIQVRNHLCS